MQLARISPDTLAFSVQQEFSLGFLGSSNKNGGKAGKRSNGMQCIPGGGPGEALQTHRAVHLRIASA